MPYVIFEFDNQYEFIQQIIGLEDKDINENLSLGKHVVVNKVYYDNSPLAKSLFAQNNLDKKEFKIIDNVLTLTPDYIDHFDTSIPYPIHGQILIAPKYFMVKTEQFIRKVNL